MTYYWTGAFFVFMGSLLFELSSAPRHVGAAILVTTGLLLLPLRHTVAPRHHRIVGD